MWNWSGSLAQCDMQLRSKRSFEDVRGERKRKKEKLQRSVKHDKLLMCSFVLFTTLGWRQLWTKLNSTSSNSRRLFLCILIEMLLIYMLIFCYGIKLFGNGSSSCFSTKVHMDKNVNEALGRDGRLWPRWQRVRIFSVRRMNNECCCEAMWRTNTGSQK